MYPPGCVSASSPKLLTLWKSWGLGKGRKWHFLITPIGVSGGHDCLSQARDSWQPPVLGAKDNTQWGDLQIQPPPLLGHLTASTKIQSTKILATICSSPVLQRHLIPSPFYRCRN